MVVVQIYIYDNTTRLSQEVEVNSTVESIVVYHLAKLTRFTVQVAAFNRAGEGLRSDAMLAGMGAPVCLQLACIISHSDLPKAASNKWE